MWGSLSNINISWDVSWIKRVGSIMKSQQMATVLRNKESTTLHMKNLSAKCAVCYMCVCVWWEIVSHCLHMSFLRRHCCSFYWEQPIWLLSWWPPPIYAKVCSESTDDHLSSWKWKRETSRQKHHWLGCDSQLDNYRGCSRATWVRSWDVPPRLAGGL